MRTFFASEFQKKVEALGQEKRAKEKELQAKVGSFKDLQNPRRRSSCAS